MSCMPDMTPTSLVVAVVPRTCKIIKNGCVLESGEDLLQNVILHFVFKLSQSSETVLRKTDFSERGLALKGLMLL